MASEVVLMLTALIILATVCIGVGNFSRLLSLDKLVGEWHPYLRKIILSASYGDGLQKLLPFISSLAVETVKSWENQAVVNSVEESEKFVFNVGVHICWRDVKLSSEEMDQIRNEIGMLMNQLCCLPH